MANNSKKWRRYVVTADFEGYPYHYRFFVDCNSFNEKIREIVNRYLEYIAEDNGFGSATIAHISNPTDRGFVGSDHICNIQRDPECIFHGKENA